MAVKPQLIVAMTFSLMQINIKDIRGNLNSNNAEIMINKVQLRKNKIKTLEEDQEQNHNREAERKLNEEQ